MNRLVLVGTIGFLLTQAATLIMLIWCAVLLSNLTPTTLPAMQLDDVSMMVSVQTAPPPSVQATPTHKPAPTNVHVATVYRGEANIRACIQARGSTELRTLWEITYPDANCF